ncbi:SMR family transporter [Erwinia billingiae]|uniref:SMR family transporter n=1 Tax=Erwinia billingiae TaxID=182337 RepID=UPI003209AAB8
MFKTYLFLGIAIIAEVIATSSLKSSESFTRLWPAVLCVLGYAVAFFFLSLTLKVLPTGIAYAIWSGVGIVLISITSYLLYGQKLDTAGIAGLILIIAGVLVVNLFSKSITH